jgi:hypothetical protein
MSRPFRILSLDGRGIMGAFGENRWQFSFVSLSELTSSSFTFAAVPLCAGNAPHIIEVMCRRQVFRERPMMSMLGWSAWG